MLRWILVQFLLTAGATIVLPRHMQAVSRMSGVPAETTLSSTDFHALRIQLVVHAGGGLLVSLADPSHPDSNDDARSGPGRESTTRTPRWAYVVGIHAIGLALLFVVLHLTGGGLRSH
jgi:hypothetical protein